jgi:flagellum-specific peptidoglycan hydrolase FlgJ
MIKIVIKITLVLSVLLNILLLWTVLDAENIEIPIEVVDVETTKIEVEEFVPGSDFRAKLLIAALKLYPETKILPSILVSQSVLETGHGKKLVGNNLFGVKANSYWKGEVVNSITKEHLPHKKYYKKSGYKFIKKINKTHSEFEVTQQFRKYNTFEESIRDYVRILSTDKYKGLVGETDYKKCLEILIKGGYATDKNYSSKLNSIVRCYGYHGVDFLINSDNFIDLLK